MFKNFKINKKLIILIASILVFFLINSVLSLNIMKIIKNNNSQLTESGLPAIIYGGEIKSDIAAFRAYELRYLLVTDEKERSELQKGFDKYIKEINDDIEQCDKYDIYSNNETIINDVKNLWDKYLQKHNEVINLLQQGSILEATKIINNESFEIYTSLRDTAEEIVELNRTMALDMANYGDNIYTTSITISIFCIIITLTISAIMSNVIIRSITEPIKQLEKSMVNLSEGNLDLTQLTYQGKDELGSLADNMRNSLNKLSTMINDLLYLMNEFADGNFTCRTKCEEAYVGEFRPLILNVRKTRVQLNEILNKINQSAEHVTLGAQQVSSSSQAASQGATQQASAVEELAATINDISVKIQSNAESAELSSKQSEEVGEGIIQSNEKMQQMVAAMAEINNSSNEISKIIKTIEDIAFQTNILALNAAVEAARAGTAGKGFAVVADEVRNLASKSAEASKNTAQLIESSINAVQRGNVLVNDASKTLMDTVEYAKKVINTIAEISNASVEQSNSVVQITQTIDQISNVVQSNSATSEESAATSQQLASQAQLLKDLINNFKLEEV